VNNKFKQQLYNRCLDLTISVIKLTNEVKNDYQLTGIVRQLINCISSIGANLSEGNGSVSKLEFIKFMNISRKSGLEGLYWFDVFIKSKILSNSGTEKASKLRKECDELVRIFTKIILTTKSKMNK
jgi:four helix bundle protein